MIREIDSCTQIGELTKVLLMHIERLLGVQTNGMNNFEIANSIKAHIADPTLLLQMQKILDNLEYHEYSGDKEISIEELKQKVRAVLSRVI